MAQLQPQEDRVRWCDVKVGDVVAYHIMHNLKHVEQLYLVLATEVGMHHRDGVCLTIVDLFNGKVSQWECDSKVGKWYGVLRGEKVVKKAGE